MIGRVSRRLVEGVVSLFAALGFLYVPLGQRTGFEHACAVLTTPAASEALADLSSTAVQLRQRAVDFVTKRASAPARDAHDEAARKRTPDHQNRLRKPEPRAVPPELK